MRSEYHAACHLLQRSSAGCGSFIWIPESLLADTIQRFARPHRRCGSSVPGPLEARKRATRRKNASLASASHRSPANSLDLLAGSGGKVGWWKAYDAAIDEAQVTKTQPSSILPWFSQNLSGVLDDCSESSKSNSLPDQLQLLLPSCHSLQQIRNLVQCLEVDVAQTPACSREIVVRLLNLERGLDEIHEFMLDGTLHTPGSFCLDEVIRWLGTHPQTKEQLKNIYNCLQKSLSLGLVWGQELQTLLTRLADVKIKEHTVISRLGDSKDIQDWYWMMADAVANCPVFHLRDLSQLQLQDWSSRLVEAPFAVAALNTFSHLQRYVSKIGDDFQSRIAIKLVSAWVCGKRQHVLCLPQMAGDVPGDDFDCLEISNFLQNLRPAVVARTLYGTTEHLTTNILTNKAPPSDLIAWSQTLWGFSESTAITILRRRHLKYIPDEVGLLTCLSRRQGVSVRLWTVIHLVSKSRDSHLRFLEQHLVRHWVKRFRRQLRPDEDTLSELMLAFRSLPLPSSSAAVAKIVESSGLHFNLHGVVDKVQAVLLNASKARTSLFSDEFNYRTAKRNLRTRLTQLADRTTTKPMAFLRTADALIMRDKDSVKVILRMLKNNQSLNLSLGRAPERLRKAPSAWVEPPPISVFEQHLTPSLALHVFASLARSIAITPVLNPRKAFYRVRWVYNHVRRHTSGAGVSQDLVRALWYAGVERRRKTGTSLTKVDWIMERVAEVEGQHVANRLLWFGPRALKGIGWDDWIDINVDVDDGVDEDDEGGEDDEDDDDEDKDGEARLPQKDHIVGGQR